MIGRAALRVADGIAERTVMAQVVQIIRNVGAVPVRAAGLALKVGAINAVEMFVFVSKRHGFLLSVKLMSLRTKQKSGGSRRHPIGDSNSRRFFSYCQGVVKGRQIILGLATLKTCAFSRL